MDTEVNVGGQGVPATRPRGWWSRNWKWFVPTVLLVWFLVCGGCCAAIFFAVVGGFKSSTPYQKALEKVRTDPQVIAKLGEPISGVFWPPPTGELHVENDRGGANLAFSVQGPQGMASVETRAQRIAGKWGLSLLVVTFADGQRLKIDVGDESGMEEAPRFEPAPAPGEKKAEEAPPPSMEFQVPER